MELDAVKRHDYALLSDLRELRFLREEKIRVIRDERECLKRLNRDKIQENLKVYRELDSAQRWYCKRNCGIC